MHCSRCMIASIVQKSISKVSQRSHVSFRHISHKATNSSTYVQRTHSCGELRSSHVGENVRLCGWLQHQRMGAFLTVRDRHGVTQVVIKEQDTEQRKFLSDIPLESVIEVSGMVVPRPEGQQNQNMATGDIEVALNEVNVVNSCRGELPFQIHDFHKVKESLRLEHRYLDLRNRELQRNLRIRSDFVMRLREFLCNKNGFIDVETPTLFRRTPGGAREFVVPTHTPGKFYSLPQSPQQFKQLLMVGGVDRYMQIARCYRDESSKPDRQPEFTQVDLEMSFVSQEGIKSLVEDLLVYSWPDHLPTPSTPFPRLPYATAMDRYGSDKPDTRFDVELHNLSSIFEGCAFPPVARALADKDSSVHAINFPKAGKILSHKEFKEINVLAKDVIKTVTEKVWYAVVRVKDDGSWQGTLGNALGCDYQTKVTEHMMLKPGDMLILATGDVNASTLLGRLRVELANSLEAKGTCMFLRSNDTPFLQSDHLLRIPYGQVTLSYHGERIRGDNLMNFLWVEDFPLFLPKEDGSEGLESAHHPFTAPHPDDEHLIYTTPEKVRSQHYDLVLNGSEIGGGSIRLHRAELQRHILNNILKEDSSTLEHLLKALEFGCPPHGGIALGLDRLVAILCGASSIRDVIAFPKSGDGRDLMSKSPAGVPAPDLQYYNITETKT